MLSAITAYSLSHCLKKTERKKSRKQRKLNSKQQMHALPILCLSKNGANLCHSQASWPPSNNQQVVVITPLRWPAWRGHVSLLRVQTNWKPSSAVRPTSINTQSQSFGQNTPWDFGPLTPADWQVGCGLHQMTSRHFCMLTLSLSGWHL